MLQFRIPRQDRLLLAWWSNVALHAEIDASAMATLAELHSRWSRSRNSAIFVRMLRRDSGDYLKTFVSFPKPVNADYAVRTKEMPKVVERL